MIDEILDPATGQTSFEIETYLRSIEPGGQVAIRNTQGGLLNFQIAAVLDVRKTSGRIYTDVSGAVGGTAWYARSGKNCFHPKGQTRLFIPTDAIRAYIETHPNGALTYRTHNPDAY